MGDDSRRGGRQDKATTAGAANRVHAELSDDDADIPQIRQAIRELAAVHGFGDRAGDLTLALDELIANAKEHGAPPIVVRGWYDGRLIVEVSDGGSGFNYGDVLRTHPPAMLGKRGRGIWIVRQVADFLRVATTENDTTVRLELTHEPGIGA